jgi:hypothetical protein
MHIHKKASKDQIQTPAHLKLTGRSMIAATCVIAQQYSSDTSSL